MSKVEHKKHVKILDIAKGFSIILMTLVHYPFIQVDNIYPNLNFLVDNVLMIFVVPIFIFISGYLIRDKLSFKAYFFIKVDGLIKPLMGFLLCLTVLNILLYIISSDEVSINGMTKYVNALLSVFIYGNLGFVNYALWFVGALFLGLIVLKGSLVSLSLKKPLRYLFLVFIGLMLLVLINTRIEFYYLSYVPIFFTFLVLGYSFKKISDRHLNGVSFFHSKIMIIFPVLFLISCFVLNEFEIRTDLDIFLFVFNYHYLLLLSIAGIFSVFFFCRYLEKIPYLNKALVECSKASFFILGFHVFILDVYRLMFNLNVYNPFLHFVLFVLNILMCYIIYRIATQIPFIRLLFVPLKRIDLFKNEMRLIKYKPINRLIPSEIINLN
ncbi:acyltransferase [Algibacter aquimarinus]|uniref:Acyltransferase family protein n=1 Tax=Algibacter aquimarinus TaxID=1136748 RepID=A0ABP9HRS8_9FLAO